MTMKKAEKRTWRTFWIPLLAAGLAICWTEVVNAAPMPSKVVIRCGSGLTAKHFPVITANKIAELAAQKSNNQIEFQFFLQGVLGSERDLYEGLQLGTVDAVVGLVTVLSNFDPRIGVLDIPYIFESIDHAHNVFVKGNVGNIINEGLVKRAGIRVAGWLVGGPQEEFRTLSTTTKDVQKPEDLHGLKVRVPESPIYREFFKLYGANPTPMPMGEVYTSLQTNVIDGLEIPPYAILTRKYYEVLKYMPLTNHMYTANVLVMGEKFYSKLAPEVKNILSEAIKEGIAWQQKQQPPQDVLETLRKNGMKVTTIDLKPFREKARGLQDTFAKKVGGTDLLKEILAGK